MCFLPFALYGSLRDFIPSPHFFYTNWTSSFSIPILKKTSLPGGVKLVKSQALVIALCLEHGALGYLCITYWFGGTTLGCKTKIKKLGINYFSRGHSELVSHSWSPPGKKKQMPASVVDSGILIFLSEQKKAFAVSISLCAQIGLLHSCLLPPRLLPAQQRRAPVRCMLVLL